MDWDLIWKAILIVVVGTFLLRIAGRKSISQMTLTETVIMISIGSLLIQPVADKNIWVTFIIGAILVFTLIIMEFLQVKGDLFENLITGKSKVLIENGNLNEKNLKKVRLTVDQLEMNLRQKSVSKISDVKWATLEPNGQVGFILKEEAQPVTKKEFQLLLTQIQQTMQNLVPTENNQEKSTKQDIFSEIEKEDHSETPPEKLL
ncbi:DUF421 domain-containing protein [Virgibacillus necropolis]|uniref:DUF421 domain-containing protein n=1 Tax=Virgibacillus necropolis TaxID=163877 RepID=A0A221M8F0_9BACI|nr:DUF421 domain-containing protein [Virgibacillus necropolis]ASN03936.1 DUF421 domain-containing protein [Virgibacillus necropolis]